MKFVNKSKARLPTVLPSINTLKKGAHFYSDVCLIVKARIMTQLEFTKAKADYLEKQKAKFPSILRSTVCLIDGYDHNCQLQKLQGALQFFQKQYFYIQYAECASNGLVLIMVKENLRLVVR
jgi:hypothetical protein